MKKKYIQLGIVALLLVGMVAAYLLLSKAPAPTADASSTAEQFYVVGAAGAASVKEINIKNEYGEYTITPKQNGDKVEPMINGFESYSLDTYGLGTTWESAKALVAKQVVAEDATAEELATYGLSTPRVTAQITNADGQKSTVLFGADAPGGEGMYTKTDASNKVYLVAAAIAEPYFRPNYAYINKTISETDPEFKGFDKITLSGTNYPEPIVIERTPDTTLEAGGMMFNTHSLVSPIKSGMDSQRGLEPLATVYGLMANEVVAASADAATVEKFGLTNPPTIISVVGAQSNPTMTFTLKISAPDAGGEVFIIKDSSPVIYKVSASALPWLSLQLFDYMEKMVFLPHIDKVDTLKLTLPNKTYEFKLSGTEDELKVTLDGKDIAEAKKPDGEAVTADKNFRQFYQIVISAQYDSPTEEIIPEGATPIAQMEYTYRDGKSPDFVRFYAGPTRKVIIVLNDGKPYYSQSIFIDRVAENAERIANGEYVKAY